MTNKLLSFLFTNRTFSVKITQGLLVFSDSIILWGTGLFFYTVLVDWNEKHFFSYVFILSFQTILMIIFYNITNLYKVDPVPHPIQQIKKVFIVNSSLFLFCIVLLFAFKISADFSRLWLLSWYMVSMGLICLVRMMYYLALRKLAYKGHLIRNVVIYGADGQANKLMRKINTQDYPWVKVAGCFDDRSDERVSLDPVHTIQGGINSLIRFIRENNCEEVLIALPWSAEKRIHEIIRKIRVLPVSIYLVPDMIGLDYSQYSYENFSGIPVLNVQNKPLLDWDCVVKVIEDRVLAFIFIILLLPFFIIIAVLIKMDSPGPVFFRQKRYGFNNGLINIYKFRSLRVAQQDNHAENLVSKGDPRVTRVGAFIRRTSLDELPQLINVLKGEMSIVGPRPHALKASVAGELYDQAVTEYAARHKVKPGMTGWAQVNGWRGETDTKEKIIKRVEYDMYYIENWSLYLDLVIIFRTPKSLFNQKNAY